MLTGKSFAMRDRISTLKSLLSKVPLFLGLEDGALSALAEACRVRRYRKKETVFHEGDSGHVLYIVISGSVAVTTLNADGENTHIADRGPGEHIGELGLFDGRRRSATVSAIQTWKCWRWSVMNSSPLRPSIQPSRRT